MIEKLGLRLRFALFFAALFLGASAVTIGGLWLGYRRAGGGVDGYVIAGVIAAFGLLGITAWIAFLFDENVAKPILALASDMKNRARAKVEVKIDVEQSRYLGALAPAANAINEALISLRTKQEHAIATETERIGRDKVLFEALLRDLAEGVVVATPDFRVMLYNRVAQDLLGNLGLDRDLTTSLRSEPLTHALERLSKRLSRDPAAIETFLAATTAGEKFLLGRVGAVTSEGKKIGYVLIFQDATEDLAAHREHDHLFNTLLEGTRRPVAAIRAVLDVLQSEAEMPPELRVTFNASMQEEVDRLMADLRDIGRRHDEAVRRHWPMSEVSTDDIFLGLKARDIVDLENSSEELFLTCDAFAVLELLTSILQHLDQSGSRAAYQFNTATRDEQVHLRLCWVGDALPYGKLEDWLQQPLSPVYGLYSGHDTLATHRTEIWSEQTDDGHQIVLPLSASNAPKLRPADERPEFYDFNLPLPGSEAEPDDRRLSDLSFVVFDTETTGLSPRGGDEIVQIAGIRVVNGRILRGEAFDTLVDPKRPIPPGSTDVHGISDAMVRGAPDIAEAGRSFHDYCDGSVLVAHNAPFDLAFLRLKQEQIGRRFDHPVLCTVLLSAAMFDHTGQHTLDALCDRFGVDLPENLRHTALGDAMATAEVFRQMLDVMKGEGIETLGQATAAARQMTRIRKAQNYE